MKRAAAAVTIADPRPLGQPPGVSQLPPSVVESTSELPSLCIDNPFARARIYLHGAHVTAFRPVGAGEVLWMSGRSRFEAGTPIRGGIPLCFPWFGPAAHPGKPSHGFARTSTFDLQEAAELPDGRTTVTLRLRDTAATRALWEYGFSLTATIVVGPTLQVALEVKNTGDRPFFFEEALHSYFDVLDARAVALRGLEGAPYIDKVQDEDTARQGEAPMRFAAETDRIYESAGPCAIVDPGYGRTITIAKGGSANTVVWNPWIAKAARMADFGDHEWPGMLCVESANTGANRVALQPGGSHRIEIEISTAAQR